MSAIALVRTVRFGLVGLLLGYCLSRVGFTDFGEVHHMFLLTDLRMFLTFCGAVTIATIGFAVLTRTQKPGRRLVHPGTIVGGVLFGVGWAITGACPSIALAQLGEGKLPALLTMVAILAGNGVYAVVHKRYFRWDPGSCEA